jgi:hypothetical protein
MDEGGAVRPHTIDAMMRLAGRQDTAVTVNHAGTPEATVVVQLGRAVVYLHSMETADRFASIWQGAQRDAEQLPRSRNLDRGPRTGPLAIAEPSIVVHAAGTPAATVRVGRGPRLAADFLGIQVGNLAWRLYDQAAFSTSAEAFLRAQRAAREHLKRADPFRGERLRMQPALPRRTTAALREQPPRPQRPGAADPSTTDPSATDTSATDTGATETGSGEQAGAPRNRTHPAAIARGAFTPPPPAAASRWGIRRPPAPVERPTSAAARLGLRSPLQAPSPTTRRSTR